MRSIDLFQLFLGPTPLSKACGAGGSLVKEIIEITIAFFLWFSFSAYFLYILFRSSFLKRLAGTVFHGGSLLHGCLVNWAARSALIWFNAAFTDGFVCALIYRLHGRRGSARRMGCASVVISPRFTLPP